MKYLLDTNMCIYLIKQKPASVINKFKHLSAKQVSISAITHAELQYGVAKSQHKEKNQHALKKFISSLYILPFEEEAAVCYGALRAYLEQKGKPIGPLDLLIAAHALCHRLILVTNNIKEFSRVPHLQVENWI